MPSPNANPTPITPPRVPLIDPRTGLIDRAWYLFFLSLNNIATNVVDDVGPSPESLIASYDAALQTLAQTVETQPLPIDLSADLAALKQEVETAPRLEIGTIASQNAENVNITGGKISGLVPPLPTASGGTALSSFTSGGAMYATSTTPATKKHPFLKNQVQISKMGQNFMKIRGLVKIGARRRKNLSRRRKIFVKKIFYFRQKNVVKISKNSGHQKLEFRTSHTPGNPYILQYFHENSGRKTSKKAPKFPGNPYILANLGPKFSPKLSKISR